MQKINSAAFLVLFPESFVRHYPRGIHPLGRIRRQHGLVVGEISVEPYLSVNHSANFHTSRIDVQHFIPTRIFSNAEVKNRIHMKVEFRCADRIEIGFLLVKMLKYWPTAFIGM